MNEKLSLGTLFLVLGTWALVIVTLYSTCMVKKSYENQNYELQKATKLQWRPFLNIMHSNQNITLNFNHGESFESDTISSLFSETPLSSPQYISVQSVRFHATRNITYINTGSTPLHINAVLSSALSQDEWENKYHESVEEMVNDIRNYEEFKSYETDVIINPSDTFYSDTKRGFVRRMPISKFEKYLAIDSNTVFYPYTYVEYSDYFGNSYNTFLMQALIVSFGVMGDTLKLLESGGEPILERYRWDVVLDNKK